MSIKANKDHLTSNAKENIGAESRISEYQRRYDSVMEMTKNKENKLSLYGRNIVKRQGRQL